MILKSLNHLELNHYTITSYPTNKLNSCESRQLFSETFPLASEQYSAVFSSGLPVSWNISIKNFTYRGALSYFFSDCCSTTATFRTFCHSSWHQKQFISPGILTITTLHKPLPPLYCKVNCLVTSRCDDKIEPCGGSERFSSESLHVLKLIK